MHVRMLEYIGITLGVVFLFYCPILLMRIIYRKKKHPRYSKKQQTAELIFIFYLLCLFQITAFRFGGIGWDFDKMINRVTRVNTVPLEAARKWIEYGAWWHLFYNVIGNCLWFMPFGFLMPAIYPEYRNHGWIVTFMGMSVSMLIEVLQFVLCTGVTDIDDVIFNTIGTLIGYLIWLMVEVFTRKPVIEEKNQTTNKIESFN